MNGNAEARGEEGSVTRLPAVERTVVDDLLLHLKRLVRVRTLLEDRGASVTVIEEHTAEIERVRAELAELARESAA